MASSWVAASVLYIYNNIYIINIYIIYIIADSFLVELLSFYCELDTTKSAMERGSPN